MANNQVNIMVAGAHSMGALGAIRSLGRAGYSVHAVTPLSDALGLKSNFATHSVVHPPTHTPEFEKWFNDYVHKHDIRMIIPGGGISPGGSPTIDQYMHLFPVKNNETTLNKARKYELFESILASDARNKQNLPPIFLIDFSQSSAKEKDLSKLTYPIFIKLDGAHSTDKSGDNVVRCDNISSALENLHSISKSYTKCVIQGFVSGKGVGVFLLRWNGKIIAQFMHRRLHEMPHTGGASSLRESWFNDEILQDAKRKLALIDWQGVAMVEYRWDEKTGKFHLMEMNLRFWGSIHLALYSDVDFPKFLAEAFFNKNNPPLLTYKSAIKCRNTFPYEIGYLVSLWRDKNVKASNKFYSIIEMVLLSLNPKVNNDLFFPGDRKLFFIRLWKFITTGQ